MNAFACTNVDYQPFDNCQSITDHESTVIYEHYNMSHGFRSSFLIFSVLFKLLFLKYHGSFKIDKQD